MQAVITVLSILLVIDSIVMIVLVMMQEGDEKGLSSSIAGGYSADSYASKNAGRTKEGQLKKFTRITLAVFLVFALAINILQ